MIAIALPAKSATYHREATACAAEMLRGFTRADRRVIVCKGQVDMADLVLAALEITGPARVTISTWETDADRVVPMLRACLDDRRIASLRLMLPTGDHDTDGRDMSGIDVIEAANHAKVATLRNERWNLAIHGSPNLAAKDIAEQFEIEDSPEICDTWAGYLDAPKAKARYPRAEAMALAREALDVLPVGGRAWGISDGYSLIHLLRAAVERVGAGATVETLSWACGGDEAAELARMHDTGEIDALRVLVCPWFFQLEKKRRDTRANATNITDVLGARLRSFRTHGRFFVVRGDARAIVVHSSANLNRNGNTEQWSASEEPEAAAFWSKFHADAWRACPAGYPTVDQQHAAERAAFQKGTSLLDLPLGFGQSPLGFPAPFVMPVLPERPPPPGEFLLHMARAYHTDPPIARRYDTDPPLALP